MGSARNSSMLVVALVHERQRLGRVICFFSLFESVALAGQCCHRPARFRHRNVYSIRVDHLPLGKL
jgi:hypothetical protein